MTLTSYQQGILKKVKKINNNGKSPCYVFYVFKYKNILVYKLGCANYGLINFFWNLPEFSFSILCAFETELNLKSAMLIFKKIMTDGIPEFTGYSLFITTGYFRYTLNSIPKIKNVFGINNLDIKFIYGYDEKNFTRIVYTDLILAIKKLYFFKLDLLCDDLKISILDQLCYF